MCEIHRDVSFCSYTVADYDTKPLIIQDTLLNSITVNHPLVINDPFVRFYAGANIIVDSCNVGTLCIIDLKPRPDFDEKSTKILMDMTEMVTELFITSGLKKYLG